MDATRRPRRRQERPRARPRPGAATSLDVSGGWYDAKRSRQAHVVNGGIAVWTLQNEYERARYLGKNADDLADGKLNIPEGKNGAPDLLDEARWEMEWMLKMQVPAGQPLAGSMAHHKIHDESWSPGSPLGRDQDPIKRWLRRQSTAATPATSPPAPPRAARLWKTFDPAFSKRALDAAEVAFAAAKKNPSVIAEGEVKWRRRPTATPPSKTKALLGRGRALASPPASPSTRRSFEASPPHHKTITTSGKRGGSASMSWDQLATRGKISLAVVPNGLGKAAIDDQLKQIMRAPPTPAPGLLPQARLPRPARERDALPVGIQLVHPQRHGRHGPGLRVSPRIRST